MDSNGRWTRERLDAAFEHSQSDPSAIYLDSFSRRVFRYEGKVIKYGEPVNLQETKAISFVKQSGLNIPVPEVYSSEMCEDVGVIEMELMEGDTLKNVWGKLSKDEKQSYAQQLRHIVNQLRSLEGDYIGALGQLPAVDARRDKNRGGPFLSETDFNKFLLSNTISTTPTIYRTMLEDVLSSRKHKIVFTHGDLSPTNIIVKEGQIVGIIDWEFAGWYPEYWESIQFFRALYTDYRDYAGVIFETLYPVEYMTDHFIGQLTRH
ncbi:hypothetical protein PV08_07007 [Exophiala spinifera]|uniref:Aminoglycoside phosphotransferase domain-containing protein n=1 Tax=Exophiala spinifera TaxID=91928 RepID=A0A0D2B6A3_9EURO|nr:uncharacterized protein PV08_07007 [Exophiala spinifera]KIW14225.1 hypothetical protein PV08_07007 [Exophiala spinifera]